MMKTKEEVMGKYLEEGYDELTERERMILDRMEAEWEFNQCMPFSFG